MSLLISGFSSLVFCRERGCGCKNPKPKVNIESLARWCKKSRGKRARPELLLNSHYCSDQQHKEAVKSNQNTKNNNILSPILGKYVQNQEQQLQPFPRRITSLLD